MAGRDAAVPGEGKNSWLTGYTCDRFYRGAVYHITVKNEAGLQCGVSSVTVNGSPIEGTVIPVTEGCTEYDVTVVMG